MILADQITDASFTATINAQIEKINLPEWAFNLPEKDYQDCSPAHVTAAKTIGADGRRMSINVEVIGGSLMVQHYQEKISEPHRLVFTSFSDVYSPNGHSVIHVQWELTVTKINEHQCEFNNRVIGHATEELVLELQRQSIPFEVFKSQQDLFSISHNRQETPMFAKSIERAALIKK